MRYPDALEPVATETIRLSADLSVALPKATPKFSRWVGPPPVDTYGNKAIVAIKGEPLFAELAILRLFQAAGWEGAWIDTYRNQRRVGFDECLLLPSAQEALLQRIYQEAGTRAGCFDVVCWNDGRVLFAESKRKGRDRFRETQRRWLAAALKIGLPPEAFLIVEWSLEDA